MEQNQQKRVHGITPWYSAAFMVRTDQSLDRTHSERVNPDFSVSLSLLLAISLRVYPSVAACDLVFNHFLSPPRQRQKI